MEREDGIGSMGGNPDREGIMSQYFILLKYAHFVGYGKYCGIMIHYILLESFTFFTLLYA